MAQRSAQRRGVSLVMVTCMVAVAGVMSAAMLSSASLQTAVAGGQQQGVSADALAESGLNLGIYYLNNIHDTTKCPFVTLAVGSTWTRNNNTLGTDSSGAYNLAVTRQTANRFRVVAKGTSPSSGGTSISKTLSVIAEVNYTTHAATFSGNVVIPANMTIEGNVYTPGSVTNNGRIKGKVWTSSYSGTLLEETVDVVNALLGGGSSGNDNVKTPDGKALSVPVASAVSHYASYVYNGRSYAAKTISTATLSNTTLGPTADNPAGIFLRNGTLDINGNVKINGTLVVMGGSLRVQGTGNTVTVSADNFPALVVDQDITYKALNSTLDVTGLTWFGGKVTRSSVLVLNSSLKVRGALANVGGNSAFDPNFGTIYVKHDRTKAQTSNLVAAVPRPTPVSVTVVTFKNQN